MNGGRYGQEGLVANRRYTDEFKVERSSWANPSEVTRPPSDWVFRNQACGNGVKLSRAGKLRAADGAAVAVKRSLSEVEAENARLRKELASAKLDLEIVKKAAGVFREGVAVRYAWI